MPKIPVIRLYRLAPLCPGTVALFSPFQLSLAPASPSHLHLSTASALPQPLRLQHPAPPRVAQGHTATSLTFWEPPCCK